MTEIVQIAGGFIDQEREYTGPERELRVDTSNWDLLIHDGVTPGGHRLQNQDNADQRYQAKSDELSGIGPFTPEARGFLTRRGPGDYRLRKLVASSAFTLAAADGYAGDPTISLSGVIDQDMTFNLDVGVLGTLTVDNGIKGDLEGSLTGTVVGNLTGNVIGNVIGNVQGNVTGNLTGKHVGAIDARNAAIQFSDNSLQLSWISGLLSYIRANAIPLGTIALWSGTIGSIPSGWVICDGNNGTPNLASRFIMGASGVTPPGSTGGSTSVNGTTTTAGSHNHPSSGISATALAESQMPSHNHAFGVSVPIQGTGFGYTGVNGVSGGSLSQTGYTGGGAGHSHGLSITTDGNHSHDWSATHLPPYYALAYIMKIA